MPQGQEVESEGHTSPKPLFWTVTSGPTGHHVVTLSPDPVLSMAVSQLPKLQILTVLVLVKDKTRHVRRVILFLQSGELSAGGERLLREVWPWACVGRKSQV